MKVAYIFRIQELIVHLIDEATENGKRQDQ